jgi:putative nucleotidyltransferase with HDIG domain
MLEGVDLSPDEGGMSVGEQSLLTRIVRTTGDLPTMPQVASLVIEKLSDPNSSPKEIHHLISKDQALAARVLRIANSPFFGHARTVTRLTDAIILMGFNSVRSLVLTSVFNDLFKSFGLTEKLLWEHSLVCGSVSQKLAQALRFPRTEEAFLVGLMHDIGKVIFNLKLPEKMAPIVQEVYNTQERTFAEMEEETFGFSHAELGQAIAGKWNFAKEIEEAIGNHHHPERSTIMPLLSHIVHLANACCHKLEIGPIRKPDLDLTQVASTSALNLHQEAMSRLLEEIAEMVQAHQGITLF